MITEEEIKIRLARINELLAMPLIDSQLIADLKTEKRVLEQKLERLAGSKDV